MYKKYLTALLVVLVTLDLFTTLRLSYSLPLDGDLTPVVLPAPWFEAVLQDPFGWSALREHAVYNATNRFFAHAEMVLYWRNIPAFLQHFVSPITSLYAASALFATLTHAGLLLLLAGYVRLLGSGGQGSTWQFWLVAVLLTPLFQVSGFYSQMGLLDRAVTYTFFYGFALLLLLVVLWPFGRAIGRQQPLHLAVPSVVLVVGLMVVVTFNGPVDTAVASLVLLLVGLYWVGAQWRRWRSGTTPPSLATGWLSGQALALLTGFGLLVLYSLYLGTFNVENGQPHTLPELYQLLWQGIPMYFSYQPGLPVLLAMLAVSALLTWRMPPSASRRRVLQALGWVGLFSGLYLLLLPLGGYRPYRPYLLRNDTMAPVLLALYFAYGLTAFFLLSHLRGWQRGSYVALVGVFSAFFLYADRALEVPEAENNGCERWALDELAHATAPVVELGSGCNVLMWYPATDFHESAIPGEMLYYWGVTPDKKLYHQK